MTNIERILTEAFDTLPDIAGFKPKFRWGNKQHLNKIITGFNEATETPYPLIYLLSNESTQYTKRNAADVNLSLIIAIQSNDTSLTNEIRWALNFEQRLFPLVDYIEQCFKRGSVFTWDGEYTRLTFPNYGNDANENFTIDTWDAVRIDTTITIQDVCLQPIFYDLIQITT